VRPPEPAPAAPKPPKVRTPQERYPRLFGAFRHFFAKAAKTCEGKPVHPKACDMDSDDVLVDFRVTIYVEGEKVVNIQGSQKSPLLLSEPMHPEAPAIFKDILHMQLTRPAQAAFQRIINKRLPKIEPGNDQPFRPVPRALADSGSREE